MFRQQLHGIRIPVAARQLYKEGIQNLYRGLLPPLMQKTTSMAIMFGTYHQYKIVSLEGIRINKNKLVEFIVSESN